MSGAATVVKRTVASVPARTASETWAVIVDLIAPDPHSAAHRDLDAVAGVAASLITDEALRDDALVVHGAGPRLRIYCVYGDDAIEGDRASEGALSFVATDGEWNMSLPCAEEDLMWVRRSLARGSSRVTARPLGDPVQGESTTDGTEGRTSEAARAPVVDLDAFLRR